MQRGPGFRGHVCSQCREVLGSEVTCAINAERSWVQRSRVLSMQRGPGFDPGCEPDQEGGHVCYQCREVLGLIQGVSQIRRAVTCAINAERSWVQRSRVLSMQRGPGFDPGCEPDQEGGHVCYQCREVLGLIQGVSQIRRAVTCAI
ncbi:hypothetical protein J4Q44_G00292840, partial [Coregonus suidteri]